MLTGHQPASRHESLMPVSTEDFTADCAHCAALCCLAFAFDRSDEFGHDKPANHPCHFLDRGFGCSIHTDLGRKGYAGCIRFDCHGAGQRVVQNLFGGRDWKSEPALLAPMADAFRSMRRLHELLMMLDAAGDLGLDDKAEDLRLSLTASLRPDPDWTAQSLAAFDIDAADAAVSGFLKSLAMRMASP